MRSDSTNSNNSNNNDLHAGFAGFKWEVHKFGGTSVASSECFVTVAGIIEEHLGLSSNNNGDPTTYSDLNLAVVVSAMGGKPKVTDLLLSTVSAAAKRDSEKVKEAMDQITTKHQTCIDELFPDDQDERKRLQDAIQSDMGDIGDILKTVSVMKWQATRISELVSGYGELWSSQILAALLRQRAKARSDMQGVNEDPYKHHEFCFLDARRIIIIDEEAIQNGQVCWDMSKECMEEVHRKEVARLANQFGSEDEYVLHYVVTGYVASNTDGVATTLQRDGSDYSAAIMGRLLQSNKITIWTDVNGVMSADPRRVSQAYVIPEVSYNEAMELAYFGAKVIHPKTMQPAISSKPRQIPIYIRNTFCSSDPGTRIFTSSTTHTDRDKCVCGFSSVDHMALINVEGSGLIGVPGVARRMFATLESLGVNIVLISQASSEHSITFATNEQQAELAKTAIEEEFRKELVANRITSVDVQSPCSIIAAVGDGMSHTSGVSGRFFSALGDAKINVIAISQGCSERNISAVVMTNESTRALRAVHAAFRLSQTVVRVGVVGMNDLGISLLKLLETQRDKLRSAFDVDLEVCAIVAEGKSKDLVVLKNDGDGNSGSLTYGAFKKVTRDSVSSDEPGETEQVDKAEEMATVVTGGLSSMFKCLFNDECPHHVVFDCTNDELVSDLHAEWLREGVHVVTANNTGLSGSREQRLSISEAEIKYGKLSAQYLREVTVGGGLPIVSTLRSLLNSGDKIRRIDGILSVSLSYIMFRISPPPEISRCSEFDELFSQGAFRGDLSTSPEAQIGRACLFSEAVKEAISLGLMEEHPEKDLSNEYSARVLMVLAKELGLDQYHDTHQIQESADQFFDVSHNELYTAQLDQRIKDRVEDAERQGCVLRHISSVDVKAKSLNIKLVAVPNNHIFAVTPPSCECVRFFTQRHKRYPLVIQGPSAGADSTASALLAELLNLMRSKVGPRSGALSRTASSAYLK